MGENVRSVTEVSDQMRSDHWEPFAGQEARRNPNFMALKKRVKNQMLIAMIGREPAVSEITVEIVAEE